MTFDQAKRKYAALCKMTVANGCTVHEAATARRLAADLHGRWNSDFDFRRWMRQEQAAAARFNWEYRRCGKRRCWCMKTAGKGHGPYKYTKKREGRLVYSVYRGK